MSTSVVTPNNFVFGTLDNRVSITYSSYGVVGPSLTYHNETDQTGGGTYVGDQLESTDSIFGRLITVTLDWTPDAHRRTLTLLVPAVYLNEDQEDAGTEVETLAIWTTHLEGRGRRGQMQRYEEVRLPGTAMRMGPG